MDMLTELRARRAEMRREMHLLDAQIAVLEGRPEAAALALAYANNAPRDEQDRAYFRCQAENVLGSPDEIYDGIPPEHVERVRAAVEEIRAEKAKGEKP